MRSTNYRYIPALDHLRGVAALLVLYFHGAHFIGHKLEYGLPYNPANWPRAGNPFAALIIEGHTAVSLFFVLSGFIFTVGALGGPGGQGRDFRLLGFYRNRLLRTYPLFLFVLLLGVLFGPGSPQLLPILKSVFFLANSQTAFDGGAFTYVFWSIAVEWHFYLLFPLLLLALKRAGPTALLAIVALFIAVRLGCWWTGQDMRLLAYWTLLGRMDQFLVGMLAAVAYSRAFSQSTAWDLLGVAGLAASLLALWTFNQLGGGALSNGVWVLWPTLEAACWALFVLGYLSLSRHLPTTAGRALVGLGTVSYSVYLLHYVVLEFFMSRNWDSLLSAGDSFATAMMNLAFVIMPAVIAVATASYWAVERPFLRLRGGYTDRPAVAKPASGVLEP